MKAVSIEERNKWGCIDCGCDDYIVEDSTRGANVNLIRCFGCGKRFVVLFSGLTKSPVSFEDEKTGQPVYPVVQEHPRKGILKHKYKVLDVRPENGIGEYCVPLSMKYNLTCMVKSKEAGERIVAMFNNINKKIGSNCYEDEPCFVRGINSVRTDYREWDPTWLKIKIPFCANHQKNTRLLMEKLEKKGIITEEIIWEALTAPWDFESLWKYETSHLIRACISISAFDKDLISIYKLDIVINSWADLLKMSSMNVFLHRGFHAPKTTVDEEVSLEEDLVQAYPRYRKYLETYPLIYIMYKRVDSALNKGNISEAIDAFSEYFRNPKRKKELTEMQYSEEEYSKNMLRQLERSFSFLMVSGIEYKASKSLVKK
ncbi:MAG: hypothetical protein ACOXZS_01460 [Bacilli bacterium]